MEIPKTESVDAGSSIVPEPNPNLGGAPEGETIKTEGEDEAGQAANKNYEELEAKLGTQGQELGELRTFFENISPLLDKLDESPEVVQAIIDGKIDTNIATALAEGRVDIKDVATVTKAHETVKKELGTKEYKSTSPEEVKQLVEDEVGKARKEMEEKSSLEDFQKYSQSFIEKTSDFKDYAEEIDKWLDNHDVTDVKVAYYAVKGEKSEAAAKSQADAEEAKQAKALVANAGGGAAIAQFTPEGIPIADSLIGGGKNPNSIFS